ncbi:MAG: EamA family transporter [Flavisolibacter sp.]
MLQTLLTSLAVLLRILSNPLGNLYQKNLTGRGHHPLLVNFLSYFLLSLFCIVLIPGQWGSKLSPVFWIYSLLGATVGSLGNGFLVKALQKGELSILGPINSYKSIVGIIVGIFLLGEFPNLWGIVGVAIIVAGSYLVLDTTEERFSWALLRRSEIQFRIWAMILTAIEAVFVKKLILASNVTIAFISWCMSGALFSFFLLPVFGVKPGKEFSRIHVADLKIYVLLILCIGTMQFTTNYAFAHMPVGYALSLFQLSTLVSVVLGYRVYREKDIRKKLIGAGVMMFGSVIIILS